MKPLVYGSQRKGYYVEKERYEDHKKFCGVCGLYLTEKNILGKCSECGDILCKHCGKKIVRVLYCLECIEDINNPKKGIFGILKTKKSERQAQRFRS